eukprot:TRINITY_DN469_c0_g1_i2.p1 TRINITY_DN469_c0_g1~~TRINITY_DN469_c0_g1_i2.p1  ORF type:complete len:1252 (+),score=476.89 TRINITY_DN469_c0_g1_i2:358-3756(+)
MGLLAGVPSGRPLPPWQRPQWCLGVGLTVGELALSLAAPRCFPGDKPPPVRVAYPMLPPCHHYSATMSGVQARVCAHMAADFFVRVAAGAQGFAVAEEENWARGPRAVQLLRTVHPLFERCCPGTPEPPGLRIAVAFAQCSEQNPAYVTIRDRQDLSIVVHGQRVLHVHKPAHDGDHWTMVLAEMFTDIERIWADPAEAAPDPAAPHSDSDTDSDSDDDSTSSASRRQALALRQSTMERNRLRLTKVDVTVSDSILDYNPRGFPGRLVAVVGSVRVQCLVVMLSEELRTEVSASGVSFFLDSGHFRKDLADYDALEGEQSLFAKAALLHPPDGAPLCPLEGVRTTLPLLGFVRVAATGRPFTVVVTTITPFVDYVPHLRGRGGRQRRRRRADEELQLQAEDDTQKPKPCVVELGQIDLRCKFCGDSYTLFWDTISHLLAGDESALRERPLLELYAELGVVPPPPPLPPPPQAAADAGAEALRRFAAATERAVQAALHSELSQEEGGAPAFSAPPAAWHGVGPVVHEEHYGEHAGTGGPQVDDVPDPGLGQEESTDLGLSAPFSRGSSSSPSARASAHSPPQAAGRGQDHECGAAAAAAPAASIGDLRSAVRALVPESLRGPAPGARGSGAAPAAAAAAPGAAPAAGAAPDDSGDEEEGEERSEAEGADGDSDEAYRRKKVAQKKAFDASYDAGDKEGPRDYLDEIKQNMEAQRQKTRRAVLEAAGGSVAERVKLIGHFAGLYVRVVVEGVPCEFIRNFNPTQPLILGGLLPQEDRLGIVYCRLKKHRWFPRLIKSGDPLTMSIGWRRFQTQPILAIEDRNGRNRYLKYTPLHMHCVAAFYGPVTPPNTGIIAFTNAALKREVSHFRPSATGYTIEVDQSSRIVKKLKLTGVPARVVRNTAFIKNMFNSALEVSKFEGAQIQTVSGIRGTVKKALNGKAGIFRAGFEDKISRSDIVFLKTWKQIEPYRYYNPVTNLLAREWQPMKSVAELRRERNLAVPWSVDSAYREVRRPERGPNAELKMPRTLEGALPFHKKRLREPEHRDGVSKLEAAVRGEGHRIMEPKELKRQHLEQQLLRLDQDRKNRDRKFGRVKQKKFIQKRKEADARSKERLKTLKKTLSRRADLKSGGKRQR